MKKIIDVTITVEVEVDEKKFTKDFMQDFKKHFYNLDDINDHMQFLAETEAQGLVRGYPEFIEGYGKIVNSSNTNIYRVNSKISK